MDVFRKILYMTKKETETQLFLISQEINTLRHTVNKIQLNYEELSKHCHRLEELTRQALVPK